MILFWLVIFIKLTSYMCILGRMIPLVSQIILAKIVHVITFVGSPVTSHRPFRACQIRAFHVSHVSKLFIFTSFGS